MPNDLILDSARLDALHGLNILDTPAEADFDAAVIAAAALCQTRIALVSLVDKDRQWFKARFGVDVCQTPIGQSVCALGLARPEPLIIPDLSRDDRTAENPLVSRRPGIRFYAGAPLVTQAGHILGMLCVIDMTARPQGLTPKQTAGLMDLAGDVMKRLEAGSGGQAFNPPSTMPRTTPA